MTTPYALIAPAILLVVALGMAGCKDDAKKAPPTSEPQPVVQPEEIDAGPPPVRPIEPLAFDGSEQEFLRGEGALPAWRAVTERDRLLLRRGASGAVYGTLVAGDDQLWLVDETEGAGALGIRVELPAGVAAEPPQRVVIWGRWHGEDGRWIWRGQRAGALAGDARARDVPTLEPLQPAEPEEVSLLRDVGRGSAWVLFRVLEEPMKPGDGWLVAEAEGESAAARLRMPGEREPYGGQDLRASSERWRLRKGQTYLAEVKKIARDIEGLRQLRATSLHRSSP